MSIEAKLNRLADLQARLALLDAHYDQLREDVVPEDVKQALFDIDVECAGETDALRLEITGVMVEIKADVAAHGASVKGEHLQAVYAQGKVTWDTKKLDGYMAAHPEIEAFRKVGKPSVSIRDCHVRAVPAARVFGEPAGTDGE